MYQKEEMDDLIRSYDTRPRDVIHTTCMCTTLVLYIGMVYGLVMKSSISRSSIYTSDILSL